MLRNTRTHEVDGSHKRWTKINVRIDGHKVTAQLMKVLTRESIK